MNEDSRDGLELIDALSLPFNQLLFITLELLVMCTVRRDTVVVLPSIA